MSASDANRPHGIIVFGANGSGKSTLGRELAHILGYKRMDHEDYAFAETEIPYSNERSRDEQVKLMLADIEASSGFVLSAVTGNFGAEIETLYDLAVFLSAPKETRLKRIEQREQNRRGNRVLKGGDMYEQHLKFVEFAATRSLAPIERWSETLTCPVLHIDSTEDYKKIAADIALRYCKVVGFTTNTLGT